MKIEKNVLLKDKNWFCTGGDARFFCRPTTIKECKQALLFAKKHNLEVELLGEGANVLISDDGYNGLIICPSLSAISLDETNLAVPGEAAEQRRLVTAGAGQTIQNTIDWCLDNNMIGLEEFSGIPGTIGGAVYINIHYFHYFLSQFLVKAQIINKKTGKTISVDNNWFNFEYDKSKLQEKQYVLVSATFKLKQTTDLEVAYTKGRRDEIIRQRNSRYPTERTCGSFFKNFDKNFDSKKLPFIAYYLDKLGIKGELQYGDATVSSKHANMIINRGKATSRDIITLARRMQELVFEIFGLVPQAECQFIGFEKYPLHTEKTLSSKSHPVEYAHDIRPSTEP